MFLNLGRKIEKWKFKLAFEQIHFVLINKKQRWIMLWYAILISTYVKFKRTCVYYNVIRSCVWQFELKERQVGDVATKFKMYLDHRIVN